MVECNKPTLNILWATLGKQLVFKEELRINNRNYPPKLIMDAQHCCEPTHRSQMAKKSAAVRDTSTAAILCMENSTSAVVGNNFTASARPKWILQWRHTFLRISTQ